MFGLSKREMEKKFTRSEMALLAWRSQEISASMDKIKTEGKEEGAASPKKRKVHDAQIPEGLPDRFFNEEGELDLRNVTGEEAHKYMSSIGIQLPVFAGTRKR